MPLRFAEAATEAYRFPLLIHSLLAGVDQHADELIISEGSQFSYRDLDTRIRRLGSALKDLGVEKGMTVAVMDWDSHRYLECYFAIPAIGAVLQTVNVRLSPEQILFTLRQTGAEVLLHHPDFDQLVAGMAPSLPELRHRIRTGGGASAAMRPSSANDYENLIASARNGMEFERFDENAIATTFHTTGTTGDPKAVEFSHRQLVLHTLALAATLANQPDGQGFRRADVYMPLTPMFHVHGWGVPYVATMLGVRQVYPGRYHPASLLEMKRRHSVTFSHCVPTILGMLLDEQGDAPPVDRWTMVIGGSALPEPLRQRAAAKGIVALGGYGMSETGPVATIARTLPGEPEDRLGRAGYPVPLVFARVTGSGPNGAGELELRSPWLTQGYAGAHEASERLWEGGWLHTQDLAIRDPDGAFRIVDRVKDVIKTGGEWVSAADLEELALSHPLVVEIAFVGMPDERWGERPVAAVVPSPSQAAITIDDLRAHLEPAVNAGRISRYALPDDLRIVEALPRTSVGKIDKRALRNRLLNL